jgi:phenylacetate-CoA ligase
MYPYVFTALRRAPGRRIMPLVREWDEKSRWPAERHAAEALRRVQTMVAHAYEHVPLYREKYRAAGMEPGDIKTWENYAKLPPLRRDEVRDRQSDLIADNIPLNRRSRHSTSGSSGTPVKFWIDHDRDVLHFATVHLNQRWIGFEVGERQILLWGDVGGPRGRHTWKKRSQSRLLNRMFFWSSELSEEVLLLFHRNLVRFRPKLMTAYPSRLGVFVQFCRERGLELPHVPLIISTAETLLPSQRTLFQEALGAQVFNRYGSIELGDMAHECPAHEGMHINAFRVWVETAPADGLEQGQGLILLTELYNRSTPFLRYECGDIGRLWPAETAHACPCGRTLPRLAEVVGRVIDIVRGPSGRFYTRIAFTSIARKIPGITNFQVILKRPSNRMIYRAQVEGRFPPDGVAQIERMLRSNTHDEFSITVELTENLQLTRAGKLRAVIFEDEPTG